MDISENYIDGEHFADIDKKTARNADLAVFYDHLFNDTGHEAYKGRAQSLRVCCQWWDTDYYRIQQVKDIKRVNLCKDKFCFNCQSMLAIKRQLKYAPKLNELYDLYTICHMVLTVPNCWEDELFPLLAKMYKKFRYLVRYLDGRAHIRGMDFSKYGYAGALRALEVTQSKTDGSYHPHFHSMVLLRKGIEFEYKYKNSFSYNNGEFVQKFSELEITLQKVWRLLMDGETVTKEAVEGLKEGYSVVLYPIDKGEYHEVFKYACKGAFKDGTIFDEQTFRVLYQALHSRRMIQGYGVLYNFKDEEGEILEADLTQNYEAMIAELRAWEEPVFKAESLQEIRGEKNCKYILKSNLKKLMIERRRQEEEEGQCPNSKK